MFLKQFNLKKWKTTPLEERLYHLHEVVRLASNDPAWIEPPTDSDIQRIVETSQHPLPLAGIPFAIKDNIDIQGHFTTAACASFAYQAPSDAMVVSILRSYGAIPFGKTNLDQFATGLNGTRSPYGIVRNPYNERYICGGSSSGSASVVARGFVPFALGTDTAGSGRVPASLNGLVGYKPTRGWWSTQGVVPASPSLDCVSIFTHNVGDASFLAKLIGRYDPNDPSARCAKPKTSIPRKLRLASFNTLNFDGNEACQTAFNACLATWRWMGYEIVSIPRQPFDTMADLLYQGPWLAERVEVLKRLCPHSQDLHPVLQEIVLKAESLSGYDVFRAFSLRQKLLREIHSLLKSFDALLVPTIPRPYTIDEILNQPHELNNRLGMYTNFVNLADLCALSLPTGIQTDGIPFGITLIAPAWHDYLLLDLGREWEPHSQRVLLAVAGAHMQGFPLNHLLTERGGYLVEVTLTSPFYRMFLLDCQNPPRPGLVRNSQGSSIEVEIWSVPQHALGAITFETKPPLCIGNVELKNREWIKGFLCEPQSLTQAREITNYGGWRAYCHEN